MERLHRQSLATRLGVFVLATCLAAAGSLLAPKAMACTEEQAVAGLCVKGRAHYTTHSAPTQEATPRWFEIAVDRAFTGQQYDDILFAISEWNIVLRNDIAMSFAPTRFQSQESTDGRRPRGLHVLRVDSRHPIVQGPGFENTLAITTGSPQSGHIYVVADRLHKRDLTGILMHEIGHALRISHLEKGLMERYYNPRSQRCIDVVTVREVARVHQLSFEILDWCL